MIASRVLMSPARVPIILAMLAPAPRERIPFNKALFIVLFVPDPSTLRRRADDMAGNILVGYVMRSRLFRQRYLYRSARRWALFTGGVSIVSNILVSRAA